MKILSINIHAFGQLHHKTIEFKEGLNIVYGLNEQGKSTIHKFIEVMFYGFYKAYTKNRQYEEAYEQYRPWHHTGYSGTLTLEDQGHQVRIERQLIKGQETLKIYDVCSGDEITNSYDYNKVMRQVEPGLKHFGHNKITYRNTVSMTQLSAKTEAAMITEIKDNMNNLTSTHQGSISIEQVVGKIEKLENEIGSLRKKTSPYYLLVEEIKRLESEGVKSKKVLSESQHEKLNEEELKVQLETLLAKKRCLQEDLQYMDALKQQKVAVQVIQLQKEIRQTEEVLLAHGLYERFTVEEADRLRRQLTEINSGNQKVKAIQSEKLSLEDQIEKLSADVEAIPNKKDLTEVYEKLNRVVYKYNDLSEKLKHRKDEKAVIKKQKEQINPVSGAGNALIPYTLLSIIMLLAVTIVWSEWLIIGGITVVVLIMVIGVFYLNKGQANRYKQYLLDVSNLDQSLLFIDNEMSTIETAMLHQLDLFEVMDFYELTAKRDRALATLTIAEEKIKVVDIKKQSIEDLSSTMSHNEEEAQGLGLELGKMQVKWQQAMMKWGFESEEDIQLGLKAYMAYAKALTIKQQLQERMALLCDGHTFEVIKSYEEIEVRPLQWEDEVSINATLAAIEVEISALKDKVGLTMGRRMRLLETTRPMVEIEEEIGIKKNLLRDFDHELAVAGLMKTTVLSIATDIQNNFAPTLNKTMSEIVSAITNGRYSDIKVNPELELTIYDHLSHKTVAVEQLSAGTIDSIYFGLRLGMSTVLTEGKKLPLILDDVFIQYDDERVGEAMKLLHQADRQVLLFTCHHREMACLTKENKGFITIFL